jgi:transcription-repair coupling factor (superfamily II helicase)
VASLRAGGPALAEEQWAPQITVGVPVLIPEHYVPDLELRLDLYRRLARIGEDSNAESGGDAESEIEAFGAELVDRFGPLPDEVKYLLRIVALKAHCLKAGVEEVTAGPKGAVIKFRDNAFANPDALIRHIADQGSTAKVRPDQRLVFLRDWPTPEDRLKGSAVILRQLVKLAEGGRTAPPEPAQLVRAAAALPANAGEKSAARLPTAKGKFAAAPNLSPKSGTGVGSARATGRPMNRR